MILRVLTPPHIGAQAEIGDEPLSLGSSMDADLILTDPLLLPVHCTIQRGPDGTVIESLEGKAYLDGQPISETPIRVHPGQILTIGSTHIAFGEPNQVWDEIHLPDVLSFGGKVQNSSETDAPDPNSKLQHADSSTSEPKKSHFVRNLLLTALVALLIVGLASFFYQAEARRDPTSVVRKDGNPASFFAPDPSASEPDSSHAETVSHEIQRLVSGATVEIAERSGRPFLRIYVRTKAQADAVKRIVNSATPPVFSEIVSLEEIEKSAEMIAAMSGFVVDLTFSKDGTAYWAGYLPHPDHWKTLRTQVERDLPNIRENVNNLIYAADVKTDFLDRLKQNRMDAALEFKPGNKEITITGTIAPGQERAWEALFGELKATYQDSVVLIDQTSSRAPETVESNPFHTAIVGVRLGNLPAILLADGQRVYEGAILQDGSTVSDIQEAQLLISGPNGIKAIPINDSESN